MTEKLDQEYKKIAIGYRDTYFFHFFLNIGPLIKLPSCFNVQYLFQVAVFI